MCYCHTCSDALRYAFHFSYYLGVEEGRNLVHILLRHCWVALEDEKVGCRSLIGLINSADCAGLSASLANF